MHFLLIASLFLDPPSADWDCVKLFVRVCVDTHRALMPGTASVPHLTQLLA